MAPYAAAKSGMARIVEALSEEQRPRRIRINRIAPTFIDTSRNRAEMPDANPADWTKPDAIADVIAFLLSPQSRAINGALLPVTNNA
ncbi:Enoyl-(Acyl carrier protein) reductase [Sphingobium sp. AP50]|uniref:SDR family oxidoreductase n=1 Tax=Sphingobium sp. AP50 TaxID=1884369 RepID=UPI0008D67CF1|nr:Enoyl-(Acyl carrier protein) reductase [Sphingobium sp. AP50]